jgi:hypothetical protein
MSQEKFTDKSSHEIKTTRKCPMVVSKKSAHYYLRHVRSLHRSNIEIDIRKGLPRIREQWILDRNDVEELSEISSEYGKERLNDVKLNDLRFWYPQKN